jgi:hypothetical protein
MNHSQVISTFLLTKQLEKTTKEVIESNTYVRGMLCEISNAAIKTKSQFKDKYRALVIRKRHKKADVTHQPIF